MSAVVSIARLTIEEAFSAGLDGKLPADRAERWRLGREPYEPAVQVAFADSTPVAAAVTSARPATAATKIVDLWTDPERNDDAAARGVLDAVLATARSRGDAAVKWESTDAELPGFARAAGFVPMRRPWGAVGTEDRYGHVLWLRDLPHAETGYYAQTTLFTCGAVAGLIAQDHQGVPALSGEPGDRDHEIAFWRAASNYPACEPVGLGVALRERLGGTGAPVEIALDAEGPVLLEEFTGFDRDFRAELQADSLRRAEELGVPVRRDRVTMAELARRIAAGESALLLIDEAPMHADPGPHWITAHATDGEIVVVEDPWVNVESGESWVDTHELPVRLDELDRMVRWGADGYRGVVFLARP